MSALSSAVQYQEAITGEVPYAGVNDMAVLYAIIEKRAPKRPEKHIPITSVHGELLWSLLNRCCASGPGSRPTVEQVRDDVSIHEHLLRVAANPSTDGRDSAYGLGRH
jgi:serine/threonine protein kinase